MPVSLEQIVEDASAKAKLKRGLLHAARVESSLLGQGADNRLSLESQAPILFPCCFPLLPLLHLKPGQTFAGTLSGISVQKSGIKVQLFCS
jgi:hypothetical protein